MNEEAQLFIGSSGTFLNIPQGQDSIITFVNPNAEDDVHVRWWNQMFGNETGTV